MEIGAGWVYLLYASSSMWYAGAQTPSVSSWQADEALAELGSHRTARVPGPMSQEQPMSQDFSSPEGSDY